MQRWKLALAVVVIACLAAFAIVLVRPRDEVGFGRTVAGLVSARLAQDGVRAFALDERVASSMHSDAMAAFDSEIRKKGMTWSAKPLFHKTLKSIESPPIGIQLPLEGTLRGRVQIDGRRDPRSVTVCVNTSCWVYEASWIYGRWKTECTGRIDSYVWY